MTSSPLYDTFGETYTVTRETDPRVAAQIWRALGEARSVLNVGAGTGSYEPSDRQVTAVEPSAVMRAQRPPGAPPVLAAVAEALPFADGSFDAAMAIATIHHWTDPLAGLKELQRVAGRVVVLTFDLDALQRFWLVRDYFPQVDDLLGDRPTMEQERAALGGRIEAVPIPADCKDGFFEAYWRRPEAYLREDVRLGISTFRRMGPEWNEQFVRRLRDDLDSGRWHERNADLLSLDSIDLGLHLLIA